VSSLEANVDSLSQVSTGTRCGCARSAIGTSSTAVADSARCYATARCREPDDHREAGYDMHVAATPCSADSTRLTPRDPRECHGTVLENARAMRFLLLSNIAVVLAIPSVARGDAALPPGVELLLGFQGGSGSSQTPPGTPDVGGAASGGSIVEALSGAVTIRGETGSVLSTSTADAFWTTAGITGTPNAFAQHALFNAANQRWYMSAEQATTGTPNSVYLAVSATGDPTSTWKAVAIPFSTQITNTHLASDGCGVYLTGDIGSGGAVVALALPDVDWVGSGAPTISNVNEATTPHNGVVPAIDATDDIATHARMFVGLDSATNGDATIDVYRLNWQGSLCSAPGPTQLALPASVDLGAPSAPPTNVAMQPSGPGLAAGNGELANAVATNGQVLGIASWQYSYNGHIGAIWFQIDVDPSTPGIVPSLAQSGEIADPVADYLAPAIAAGADGSIGIVYVATSANEYPSMYVMGHGAGDALGTLRGPVLASAGNAIYSCMPSNGVSPFGRYSSIAGTATGLWATAQIGGDATDCAFSTAWVNFTLPSTLVGGDGNPGGSDCCDDPVDDPTIEGCTGCASPGDGSVPVVLFAIVVVARRRRRRLTLD
jgi:hypothetical protein